MLQQLRRRSTSSDSVEDSVLFKFMGVQDFEKFQQNFTPEEAAERIKQFINKMEVPCVFVDQKVDGVDPSKQVFVVTEDGT